MILQPKTSSQSPAERRRVILAINIIFLLFSVGLFCFALLSSPKEIADGPGLAPIFLVVFVVGVGALWAVASSIFKRAITVDPERPGERPNEIVHLKALHLSSVLRGASAELGSIMGLSATLSGEPLVLTLPLFVISVALLLLNISFVRRELAR